MKYKRIHILGASGSGTTTLAAAFCQVNPYSHFDSDDFFWKRNIAKSVVSFI